MDININTTAAKELINRLNEYAKADNKTASFEIGVTVGGFFALFAVILWGVLHQYWAVYILLPLAGVLVTRMFTIQHDCGHGSYFSAQKANTVAGNLLGVLTLTPYYYWKKNHAFHHAFSGNLDKRGIGDVDTYTVNEYKALPWKKRAWYRLYRNPAFMLIVSPMLLFGLKHRLPIDNPFHSVKSWASVMLTNLGIFLALFTLVHFCGPEAFFLVYLPVLWVGSAISVGGFYIQHQYPDAYWSKGTEWKHFDAGLYGSSYFDFPKVFNWLFNHINLHHIHHLNLHVPSYRLQECLSAVPEMQTAPRRTYKDVLCCFRLALWDEDKKKMVGFNGR